MGSLNLIGLVFHRAVDFTGLVLNRTATEPTVLLNVSPISFTDPNG